MATYDEIHGKRVEVFSSDPTLDSSYEGQVWFNSTDGVLKSVVTTDAFISATPMPVAKSTYHRAGTMTAGLFCAGNASTGFTTSTEEWNGSGFSQGGAIGTALYSNTGFGTQTAGASAAGRPTNGSSGDTNATFEYDGSSWTSVNAANLAARTRQSFGIQTAAAMVGGFQQTTAAYNNNTEEYDGTNWTTVTAMPANAGSANCMGTQTAAIVGLGGAPTVVSTYIAYDGTNWTTSPSSNIARARSAAGGTGATNTAGLVFGGTPYSPTATATAERWDGTSFSSSPASLTTARYGAGISDGNTNGMMVGGYQGTAFQSAVEEFNSSINTLTAAAWSSGGNLNTGRQDVGGTGTKIAGLAFGGRTASPSTPLNNSEEYDGSSWTEGNNLNTSRGEASGAGTQTAAVAFGGDPVSNATENYNGTSWTTSPGTLNAGRSSGASFGASYTSAVFCGGYGPSARTDVVEEWNGSAWTNATAMPEARYNAGGAGTEPAGIICGGSNAPGGTVVFTSSIEYDGSNWTAGGTNPIPTEGHGMNGIQTACISYGGPAPNLTANTSVYDGTTWQTNPNMASCREALGASKGAAITNSMAFGGSTPPNRAMNNTEEFTAETSTINSKTLTTS